MTVWDTGTPVVCSVIVGIEQVLDTMVKVDRAYDTVGPVPGWRGPRRCTLEANPLRGRPRCVGTGHE
ncbi:hypothetical protein GCM10009831_21610 [Dietzia cercidiphylli]|uniref:Transposase n=1 Tax=Dietzia cercidiphylli TaxID=498199 RepID=A0ABN2ITS6_9ACTN